LGFMQRKRRLVQIAAIVLNSIINSFVCARVHVERERLNFNPKPTF
jgi:hypothetical protein